MSDSTHYCAFDHKEWEAAGLKDYGDFSDMVEYVNQEEDGFDQLKGEWWYPDDETLTIYWGTFGNYNSPGASSYTYAEVYETIEDYKADVKEWEDKDEYYLPVDEDDDKDDDYELDGESILDDEDDLDFSEDDAVTGGKGWEGLPPAAMVAGYCHEFEHHDDPSDEMGCTMYTPTGNEEPHHIRMIDGTPHAVFYCSHDDMYRAQTCVAVGVNPEPWMIRSEIK